MVDRLNTAAASEGRAENDTPPAQTGRDAMFAALTHELRTPLNGILGMAHLLDETGLKPDQAAYVSAIRDSGAHLLQLIDQVLDAAQLEAGADTLHPAPTDLGELVRSASEILAPKARLKNVNLAVFSDPNLPIVRLDPGRFRQIIFNIAGNAVKFTHSGAVFIRLTIENSDGARGQLALTVADTGPGVPEDKRAAIFDAYRRLDTEAGGAESGVGLGLAIVKRLVAAMGGALSVESELGVGSTFRVHVPVEIVENRTNPLSARLKGQTIGVKMACALSKRALIEQIQACGGSVERSELSGLRQIVVDAEGLADLSSEDAANAIIVIAPDQRGLLDTLHPPIKGYLIAPVRLESLVARLSDTTLPDITTETLQSGDSAPETPPDPTPRFTLRRTPRYRALLADDNPINALLARKILEREGLDVDVVTDGAQAVNSALNAHYDVIFLDLRMPNLDGLAAARRLRADGGPNARKPIIAFTANNQHADRRACLDAGMVDFLAKPFDKDDLLAVLAKWLTPEETTQ
ncbi:MAG: response regulator [Maricaulaceae bacterium]